MIPEDDRAEADFDKLNELAETLTDDQKRLLREGLAGGSELDPKTLSDALRRFDTEGMFARLGPAPLAEAEAETSDAGTTTSPEGGTTSPPPEPPLTRW